MYIVVALLVTGSVPLFFLCAACVIIITGINTKMINIEQVMTPIKNHKTILFLDHILGLTTDHEWATKIPAYWVISILMASKLGVHVNPNLGVCIFLLCFIRYKLYHRIWWGSDFYTVSIVIPYYTVTVTTNNRCYLTPTNADMKLYPTGAVGVNFYLKSLQLTCWLCYLIIVMS